MAEHKQKFVGAYIATDTKKGLVNLARSKHWSMTDLLIRIFTYALAHPEIVEITLDQIKDGKENE